MSESNPVKERYHDKICRDSHLEELSNDNARWLADRSESIDSLIRLQRIRKENPKTAVAACAYVHDDEHRPIVMAVASEGGAAHYDDIIDFFNASKRTIKRRVSDMEHYGILKIDTNANPAVIHFPNEIVEVLINDSLNLFFSTNNKMK